MKKWHQTLLGIFVLCALLLSGCAQSMESLPKNSSAQEPADHTAENGTREDNTAEGGIEGGTTESSTAEGSTAESSMNGNSASQDSATENASAPQIEFACVDLDGNTVTTEIFSQSKLTMVNVWATYCNPCLSEMPGLGELAAEYDPAEFQIIGIVSDVLEGDDQSLAESLVQQTGAAYPHLLLNQSVYAALLTQVAVVPTTFFISENGEILDTILGAMQKSAWEEKIDALLEQ